MSETDHARPPPGDPPEPVSKGPGFPRSAREQIRFSYHASKRMGEQGITREMVETVLDRPGRWFEGDTAYEYEATVEGRRLHVVLSVGLRPVIVITVYWVDP